jgi:hypothetical protein
MDTGCLRILDDLTFLRPPIEYGTSFVHHLKSIYQVPTGTPRAFSCGSRGFCASYALSAGPHSDSSESNASTLISLESIVSFLSVSFSSL